MKLCDIVLVNDEQQIRLAKVKPVSFPREGAIVFHRRKTLKEHSNGMELVAYDKEKNIVLRDAASATELVAEKRDLQADARKAFDKELPEGPVMFTGIALGADSDNTQSKAKALFGSVLAL